MNVDTESLANCNELLRYLKGHYLTFELSDIIKIIYYLSFKQSNKIKTEYFAFSLESINETDFRALKVYKLG